MRDLLRRLEEAKRGSRLVYKAIPVAYRDEDIKAITAAYRKTVTGPLSKATIKVQHSPSYISVEATVAATYQGEPGSFTMFVYRHRLESETTLGILGTFTPKKGDGVDVIPERTIPGGEEMAWPVDAQEFGEEAARVAMRRLKDAEQRGVTL